jgi:predicted nucleic acid-binding protein
MCIIVDANVMGHFTKTPTEEAALVGQWIAKRGNIVYNKELLMEYSKNYEFLKIIQQFERSGKAALVDSESKDLGDMANECLSNDKHIVALAKASKACVLFSLDQDLHGDFKNNKIVGSHDRMVFQTKKHRPQLFLKNCD